MSHSLVITGAPASGKTQCLERLRSDPLFEEFVFFDELARKLLMENPDYRNNWREFHRDIYRLQVAREQDLASRPFVTDRGTIDAFAFHPETIEQVGTTIELEYLRYSGVIQLGSAANLGPEFYKTDAIRQETIEQALAIELALRNVWGNHPNYHYLPAQSDLEGKYQAFYTIVRNLCDDNDN